MLVLAALGGLMQGGCREPLPVGCGCGCSPGQGNWGGMEFHKESYKRWKRGPREKDRDTVWASRDGVWEAKAHLALGLVRDVDLP